MFKELDVDNSGSLSIDEFARFHEELQECGLVTGGVEDCIRAIDTNHTGAIDFNEFIAYMIQLGMLEV